MLFYLSYMWGWVKIFGRGEVALRAANIPFFLLLIGSVAWASRHLLQRPYLWVLFCLSPFVWFYLNEARPYAAVTAFSAATLVALLAYILHPEEHAYWAPWCCLIALLCACGAHMLGVFLIPSLVVVVAESARTDSSFRRRFLRDWWLPVLCCLPAFLVLGGFYAWTSSHGVNKTIGNPGLFNLAFVAYEFLGFQGLGPPRNQLRGGIQLSVIANYWFWLFIGLAALAVVAVMLLRKRPPPIVRVLIISLAVGVAVAFAISRVQHFNVLGRHMAVFLPLVLLIGMFWLAGPTAKLPGRSIAVLTLVLAVAWGISDARLALLPQYKKDDYRGAASIALQRAGSTGAEILWVADPHTAHYYGIEPMKDNHPNEIGSTEGLTLPVQRLAVDGRHWTRENAVTYLDTHPGPAILVMSKPDLYDDKGGWRFVIQQRQPSLLAQLNSFVLYQLDGNSTAPSSSK